jgi:hypothetical protein
MRRLILTVAVVACMLGGASKACADNMLPGPTLNANGTDTTSWGLQFTAKDNSTLASFDFVHRYLTLIPIPLP